MVPKNSTDQNRMIWTFGLRRSKQAKYSLLFYLKVCEIKWMKSFIDVNKVIVDSVSYCSLKVPFLVLKGHRLELAWVHQLPRLLSTSPWAMPRTPPPTCVTTTLPWTSASSGVSSVNAKRADCTVKPLPGLVVAPTSNSSDAACLCLPHDFLSLMSNPAVICKKG